MSIESQILELRERLPSTVKLVAVSKFKPAEDILAAYNVGQRCFGENRPQELAAKAATLPSDIEWHFIGHLQTNKLKMVLPYASLIHSIDSLRLLEAVDRGGAALGKVIPCLLEVHIATEESKQGFSAEEILLLNFAAYPNISFRGVMGMASFVDDMVQVRSEFRSLKELRRRVATEHPELMEFDQISMGMSQDYHIAIEEGATIVRIGSTIFGARGI